MSCWEFLGLEADADERSIKRRYSQLLKARRPDEDPVAFQNLREAYEQALAFVRWQSSLNEAADEACEGQLAVESLASVERVQPVKQPSAMAREQIQALLADPSAAALEAGLIAAEAQGCRALFEECLLDRCLSDEMHGLAMAMWAQARLNWMSPWQALNLPGGEMEVLAERLLQEGLQGVRVALQAGEERSALQQIVTLGSGNWLQSFERRAWFHQRLVDLLVDMPDWSPAFFDRLCQTYDWQDSHDQLPCHPYQWQALNRRCESHVILGALRKHLNEIWPCNAEQSAAWMLLKPLSDGERRRLVDTFNEQEWQACQRLSDTLEYRFPEILEQLNVTGVCDWRRWLPKEAWGNVYRYLWVLFSLLFISTAWYSGKLSNATGGITSAVIVECVLISAMSTVVLAVLKGIHRGWHWLSTRLAEVDVWLSSLLLPRNWVRQGTGLLLVRHLCPSAFIGLLVWMWSAPFGQMAPLGGGVTATACLLFADFATRGGSFNKWRVALAERVRLPWRALGSGLLLLFCIAIVGILVKEKMGQISVLEKPLCIPQATTTNPQGELCAQPEDPQVIKDAVRFLQEARLKGVQPLSEGGSRVQ